MVLDGLVFRIHFTLSYMLSSLYDYDIVIRCLRNRNSCNSTRLHVILSQRDNVCAYFGNTLCTIVMLLCKHSSITGWAWRFSTDVFLHNI